jgi:P-type Ca2+ transporter type 2C
VNELQWHSTAPETVLRVLHTTEDGLSENDARARLRTYGRNVIVVRSDQSIVRILANQFRSVVVLLLVVAIGLAAWSGQDAQTIAITAVLLLNVGLGFFTEFRARKAVQALLQLDVPDATVLRDGDARVIDAANLVPGDVILLEAGKAVPADARLLESVDLQIVESQLTGESEAAAKQSDALVGTDVSLPDRATMCYKGSFVASGFGRAAVTGTGLKSEIGRIGTLVENIHAQRSPIEKRLDSLGGRLAVIAVLVGGALAGTVYFRGGDLSAVVQMGIAVAVSAVPEGLPAVVIITMAIAAHRMAKKHALVRRLPAVETLGSVTVVCTDKTGTLTAGHPAVTSLWVPDQEVEVQDKTSGWAEESPFRNAMLIASLANRSEIGRAGYEHGERGDPYEVALLRAAGNEGLHRPFLLTQWPPAGMVPFSSARMMMASFHYSRNDGITAFVKGAQDRVLMLCSSISTGAGREVLTEAWRARIEEQAATMSGRGLRVFALARGTVTEPNEAALQRMEFAGLVGMADPIADGVPETVAALRTAGVRTVMLTGDHAATARSVAELVGIDSAPEKMVDGKTVDGATDAELKIMVRNFGIASRLSPEGKVRIMRALQQNGEVVAMLGDGINDAAALKKADIGVAMGVRGTDFAKEVAGIVLENDDFNVIEIAVREGRVVFDNIRKFVFYLFSCNLGEILALFMAVVLGLPLPMTAMQILWLNLVTDSFTALSLAAEPADYSVMRRPPRQPGQSLLSPRMMALTAAYAVLIAIVCVVALAWGLRQWPGDPQRAATLSFTTLAIAQIFHLGNARGTKHVLTWPAVRANRFAIGAVGLALLLQVAAVNAPPLMQVLGTKAPTPMGWFVAFLLGSVPAVAGQLWKWTAPRRTVSGNSL